MLERYRAKRKSEILRAVAETATDDKVKARLLKHSNEVIAASCRAKGAVRAVRL